MKDIPYTDAMAATVHKLTHGGAFLSAAGSPPNTMTIGWATIGFLWNRPVLMAVVRASRHTLGLIEAAGTFTVSVPTKAALRAELAFAGTASGRDVDKFSGHGLTPAPARAVDAPIVAECGLHFECRVRLTQAMTPDRMDPDVLKTAYPQGDLHTMFFGEILACYTTDE
jgi:flavin reductase (DIM6/NTAB) family NADH-FMN oxidoreductase RutF